MLPFFCMFEKKHYMSLLELIAKDHVKWVRLVKSFGERNYHEDIVQEMYVLMYKYGDSSKIVFDGVVNSSYIYRCLYNLFLLFKRNQSKVNKVSLDDVINLQFVDELERFEAEQRFTDKLEQYIATLDIYEQMLFNVKVRKGKSYRQIQQSTGINKDELCKDFKRVSEKVYNELGDDYKDLINNDFELI